MGSGITSGECSTSYNITEETVSEWLFTPEDIIIITIIIPIILGLGVINNFTFLFVIFRIPKMRSATNTYLVHLALADLLYLSLSAFYNILKYTVTPVARHTPLLNSAGCVSFITVANIAYFASIALVTMMSFERYLALCHPMKHLKIRGRRLTNRMAVTCWLLGLVFGGLTTPGIAILRVDCLQWPDNDIYQGFPSTRTYCSAIQPWVPYYTEPLLNVPWLLAMVGNIFMYVRIIQILNKRRGVNNGRKDQDQKAQQIRNQVAKMLVVNGLVFFLCQTPYRAISLTGWICFIAQIPNPLYAALGTSASQWISIIPQLINTIVNPLIYGVMNSQYRAAVVQAFHCKSQARRSVRTPVASNATAVSTFTNNETNETRL